MSNPSHDVQPIYTIDSGDRIVFVNPGWVVSAHAEGCAAGRSDYIGRPVWDLLGEGGVRLLWSVLYRRVRAIGASVFVPMRVDAPDERRLVDIELRPLADRSIQHICERVWSEARPAVALLDPAWPRDGRTLRCCNWCRRIQVSIGAWQEIEDAQFTLGIEAAGPLPTLERDACVTCKQSLLKTFPARVA